jgi:hypothetical protein
MRVRHLAIAAVALLWAGPGISTPTRADFLKAKAGKSQPAAATHTVTLDLTGLD